ncbi:MAG: hypothetical protein JO316_10295 [Abitibacteriaceae bacterium]|nr:hypothetical protein [Abditibacteriaceae bacterium]MBV9865731.1 hypothetical protein [Abditibacteriaceae bacterium]
MRTVARIGLGIFILLLLAIPAWPLINRALVPYHVNAALHMAAVSCPSRSCQFSAWRPESITAKLTVK